MKRILPWALVGAAAAIGIMFLMVGTRVPAGSIAVVSTGRPEDPPVILERGWHFRPFGSSVTLFSTLPVAVSGETRAATTGGGELPMRYEAECALDAEGIALHYARLQGGPLETLCAEDIARATTERVSVDPSPDLLTPAFLDRTAEAVSTDLMGRGYSLASLTFARPDDVALLAAARSLFPIGEGQRLQTVLTDEAAVPETASSWRLLTALGMLHESRRELVEAEKYYLDAVAVEPAAIPPMSQLVALYSTVGEWQKLARVLDASLAASPESLQHINWLAMTFLRLEDYLAAEELLLRGIQIEPGNSTMLSNLGGIYLKTGRMEEAMDYLRKAVDAGPTNTQALFNLGAALAAEGQYAEALPHLEAAEETGNVSYELLRTLAIVHEKLGSQDRASSYRERLRELEADRASSQAG